MWQVACANLLSCGVHLASHVLRCPLLAASRGAGSDQAALLPLQNALKCHWARQQVCSWKHASFVHQFRGGQPVLKTACAGAVRSYWCTNPIVWVFNLCVM